MTKPIYPSEVVEVLGTQFPGVEAFTAESRIFHTDLAALSAISKLVDQIPDDCISLEPKDQATFVVMLETIRATMEYWRIGRNEIFLSRVRGYEGHPLTVLLGLLKKCPDSSTSSTVSRLPFLKDPELEAELSADLSTAHADTRNGAWKSSTVISASISEALCLWAITHSKTGATTIAKLGLSSPPEAWGLAQLITACEADGLVQSELAALLRSCKDYRNLIHPGRAQRLATKCSKGTALSTLGAAERLIETLAKIFG